MLAFLQEKYYIYIIYISKAYLVTHLNSIPLADSVSCTPSVSLVTLHLFFFNSFDFSIRLLIPRGEGVQVAFSLSVFFCLRCAGVDLELTVGLSQPLRFWDYKHAPSHLTCLFNFILNVQKACDRQIFCLVINKRQIIIN